MTKEKEITKNFLYNFIYEILIILTPLIITPYISRKLGVELIGIRSYTFAILSYFELFANLGIAMYGQREIAKKSSNIKDRSKCFLELITIKSISFSFILLLYLIIFFKYNILSNYKTIWLIWLIHLFESFFNITWYFQGRENFKLIATKGIILRIIQIILTLIFVKNPSDFYLYLIIYATTPLMQGIILWPFIFKEIKWNEFKNLNCKKHLKNIFSFFIPTISTVIYSNIDKIMLGTIINNKSEIGYYESAQSIVLLATTIFTSIYTVMRSRISANLDNNQNNFEFFIRTALFMTIAITFGLLSISNSFIVVFYGQNYLPVILILQIFCIIILFIGISSFISSIYIIPYDKQKYLNIFYIIATIVNILLNAFLIPHLGSIGAIIGSIGAEGMILLGCFFLSKKKIPFKNYIIYGWKYLISGCLMFFITKSLDSIFPNTIQFLILEILIGAITYILFLILMKDNLITSFTKIKNNNQISKL